METDKIDITQGPSIEEMSKVYRAGGQNEIRFDVHYHISRIAFIDILEIEKVEERHVEMLASMPAGFFMYSQLPDSGEHEEKLKKIQVRLFYSTNTGKGYIKKVV